MNRSSPISCYEDRDGIKRTTFDVVADEVEFLTPKSSNTRDGYEPEPPRGGMTDMQPKVLMATLGELTPAYNVKVIRQALARCVRERTRATTEIR